MSKQSHDTLDLAEQNRSVERVLEDWRKLAEQEREKEDEKDIRLGYTISIGPASVASCLMPVMPMPTPILFRLSLLNVYEFDEYYAVDFDLL